MTVAILEHPDRDWRDLSSLSAILSGAAPAPMWVWEQVRDRLGITEITTGYGMTECPTVSASLGDDGPDVRCVTDGRILPGVEVRVVDPDTGHEVGRETDEPSIIAVIGSAGFSSNNFSAGEP